MASSRPTSLAENTGLAFIGETLWTPAQLSTRQANTLEAARNATGRPNSDVIRHFVSVKSGVAQDHAQIDFPAHFHEQEVGLYLKPASHLRSQRTDPSSTWWLNPHASAALRTAIARLERYLATPLDAESPAWDWIESERLPSASLMAIARDDDFAHGILQSRIFSVWWHAWTGQFSPREIVESFPFPWPPGTLLSALTRVQEEQRLAIARAARAGDQDRLDAAVAAAYGGLGEMTNQATLAHLEKICRERTSPLQEPH